MARLPYSSLVAVSFGVGVDDNNLRVPLGAGGGGVDGELAKAFAECLVLV